MGMNKKYYLPYVLVAHVISQLKTHWMIYYDEKIFQMKNAFLVAAYVFGVTQLLAES